MPSPDEFSQAIIPYLTTIGIHVCPCKTSPWQKDQKRVSPACGLFGLPLHLLPASQKVEGVPEFLVEACELLRPHLHVEGLFRKCGSMTRIKALKARLEAGERCLHMALPCDVAALVKQFLRSLPEPLIPARLQGPLCEVQCRGGEGDRDLLTLLLTCLLPPRNTSLLRYLLSFLQDVVAKCAQNKMDLANLAVVFAPNLFSGEISGQLESGAKQQLQRQAAITRTLISHASEIGTIPQPLLEKVHAASSGMESKRLPPEVQEVAGGSSVKEGRRRRRSISHMVSEALGKFKSGRTLCTTPGQETKQDASGSPAPRASFGSKRKASEDAAAGLSVKRRRSALGSADSDPFDGGAGNLPDQPAGWSSVQGLLSPSPASPKGPLHPASPTGIPQTPTSKVQWKQGSCEKRPLRKPSSAASNSCSPTFFEQKQIGPRSLGIFSRASKDREPLSPSAKTADAGGWFLAKRKRQGAAPEWARLQSYRLRENQTGSSSWSPSKNTDVHTCPSQRGFGDTQAERLAKPKLHLQVLRPGPLEQNLGAPAGSRGLLRKMEVPAQSNRQAVDHGTLRRSLSWPEELSLRDAAEERDFFPGEASVSPDLAQPGLEAIVSGMKKLGIPAARDQLSNCPGAGCSGNRPSGLALGPFRSKPELPDASWDSSNPFWAPIKAPKTALQRLAFSFHLCSPRLGKEPRSTSKPPSGRRFGRSVSHESGLPLPDGVSARGARKQSPKNPLQHFKACGQQLFLARKHVGTSFAGLRSRREAAKPRQTSCLFKGDQSPIRQPPRSPPAEMPFAANPD